MPSPMTFDIPHQLGRDEAKRRIEAGIPKVEKHIPGGGTVEATWLTDDQVRMTVTAMGQTIDTDLTVEDTLIHAKLMLPALLSMMAGPISGFIKTSAEKMLAPPDPERRPS
jgi:hypothetical protein